MILLLDVAQTMQPETQTMQPVIVHDSRNTTYRCPFGAVEAGSVVTLRCDVEGDGKERVTLRLWQEGAGETLVAMQSETWKRKQGQKKKKIGLMKSLRRLKTQKSCLCKKKQKRRRLPIP